MKQKWSSWLRIRGPHNKDIKKRIRGPTREGQEMGEEIRGEEETEWRMHEHATMELLLYANRVKQ